MNLKKLKLMKIQRNLKMLPKLLLPLLMVMALLLPLLLENSFSNPYLCQASAVAAAVGIGSALAGLASAIFGSKSASDANALNQENFKKSLDFSKYQYEDSKVYNSAVMQAARARAAGFNPLLAMSGLTSQNQTVSVPEANPQQPIDYTKGFGAAAQLGSSLVGATLRDSQEALNYGNAGKAVAESVGTGIDNATKGLMNEGKLKNLGFENQLAESLANVAKFTQASRIQQENEEVVKRQLVNEQLKLQNEASMINNSFLNTENWARISNNLADIKYKLLTSQASLISARAAMRSAWAAERNAMKENGMFLSDKELSELHRLSFDYLISQSESQYSSAYKNYLTSPVNVGVSGVSAASPAGVRRSARIVHRK